MFIEELKKIFRIKSFLIVLAFGLVYYLLFISAQMRSYPGSYEMTVEAGKELMEKYGDSLSPEEYREYEKDYEQLKSAPGGMLETINTFIAGNALMAEYGISDVTQLEETIAEAAGSSGSSELGTLLMMEIYDTFSAEDYSNAMEEQIALDIRKNYLKLYEQEVFKDSGSENGTGYYDSLNEAQRRRVYERNTSEIYGIMPWDVRDCTFKVFQFCAFFMIAAVLFFIVPYIVKDNRSGVLPLQYTGKAGRRYDFYRLFAILAAAVIILAALSAVFLFLCKLNGIFPFWNSPVSAFASYFICWLPLSLGELVLLGLAVVIGLALGLVLIACLATRFCANYITAIAWMLPMILVGAVFCGTLIVNLLDLNQLPWLALGISAGIFAVGLAGNLIGWLWNRRRDF